jgi:tetratricopeptide (TPR) repeat protein
MNDLPLDLPLDLPDVTLCCIDTANHALALRALQKSREAIRFGRVLFLTDALPPGLVVPASIEVVTIAPLTSRDAYSRFVLRDLLAHITTSHVLLVQWDGYVVQPAAWGAQFLASDYIGAQWFWHEDGMRVGNGGFSLRSRKLLLALQDPRIELVEAEDTTICRTFRPLLESEYGIAFASETLADRFAFEASYPIGKPFGFHGLFNFCRVVPSDELAALATQFSDGIAASPQIKALLRNCLALGQWAPAAALARRILAVAPDDAESQGALAKADTAIARGTGIGRNDPCPCGSGRKYKHCHGAIGAPATVSAEPMTPVVSAANATITSVMTPAVVRDIPATPAAPAATAPDKSAATGSASASAPASAPAPIPDVPAAATPPATAAPFTATPDALAARGVEAHQRNDITGAERDYRAALALAPDHPLALHYLGVVHYQRNELPEALPVLERAVALAPDEPEFHNNLGLALAASDRLPDAIASYRRALERKPDHATAWNNLGLALQATNDVDGAIKAFREALVRVPDFAQAHWNLSLALLLSGNYAEGWREYEWRLKAGTFGAEVAANTPRWSGEDLRNRTLLLTTEQGLGDALQFIRFAQPLAERGARVIVRAPSSLLGILGAAAGVAAVIDAAAPLPVPAHDFHLPLMSVPGVLAVDEASIPRGVPYILARKSTLDHDITAMAREITGVSGALPIGLSWAGNPAHANDRRRSCPFVLLEPLLELPGVAWFSLQKGDGESDISKISAGRRVVQLDARNDFVHKAAMMQKLDLIISIDTSNAHLAGALGRPLWVVLPFAPDWRWGLGRRDSPWYPTARLFRQPRAGDWPRVIEEVRKALAAHVG